MYVPFAPCYYFQAFWLFSVPVEMSVEIEHAHPVEISIWGFDASYLLQCSANKFFRLNGKQPKIPSRKMCVPFAFFYQFQVLCQWSNQFQNSFCKLECHGSNGTTNLERNFPLGRFCLPFAKTVCQPISHGHVNGKQPVSLPPASVRFVVFPSVQSRRDCIGGPCGGERASRLNIFSKNRRF